MLGAWYVGDRNANEGTKNMTIQQIQSAIKENAAARALNAATLAEYGTRNCAAVTRLHDKRWDIEARGNMLCRLFDKAAA
jgi:hypothetical protein